MSSGYDIIEKYGLPREYCSCPSCGQLYGHHNTKVCETCEECSTCCTCPPETKKLVTPEKFIPEHT